MNAEKGFTLVEVLSIIVLLGLVALLAFPSVDKYLKSAKQEAYNTQVNNIALSAQNWGVDNKILLPKNDGETMEITLGYLMDQGYVDFDIVNPITKKPLSKELVILIRKTGNIHNYEVLD
ncbi:MAG: prepilin-type N-terminal cleavage/methylation domain-containing protein [Bacilli bacterium]|nr:prepilin-type N-terminal cleavage/methylation domain-containing protein [Bacilli bacterium]MDD4718479.1 prepilin-type N-terminal cleavage/methylation domain-containing protein [Bacilli bacterium]